MKEYIVKSITKNPNWLNHLLLKANLWPEKIYGKKYIQNKNRLNNLDFEKRLLSLTNYAIKMVPYYKELYHKPIISLDDFKWRIGFIDRQTVCDKNKYFISESIDFTKYVVGTTGGTSGKPLRFLMPKNRHIIELSTVHNIWQRTGWNYHPRAVLRNHILLKDDVYRINPITKEFIFDNFRLNPEYVNQIHKILLKYNIQFIQAYPSAAYQFCFLCKEQGLDLGFIKAFLCGSEGIIDFQKKLIVDDLGLKLYSFYGHSEKLVLGGYCEYIDHYHIEPNYGFFELIGENNNPIVTPGEFGEIVGTTLNNYGMPLIRYRTGDFAEYVGNQCEECGRKIPVIKNIQGRWDKNQIYRKDGTYITTTALNLHNDLYEVIDGIQYIQEHPGMLRILIIKGSFFQKNHEIYLKKHFSEAMGSDSEVVLEYVDKLLFQPNGKFLQLISNIKNKK